MNAEKIQSSWVYSIIKCIFYFIIPILFFSILGIFNIYFLLGLPGVLLYSTYKVFMVRSHTYTISEEQITYSKGVFSKTIEFVELYRIRDFSIKKPFLLRLINVMQVELISTDTLKPVLVMSGIPNSNIVDKIRTLVEEQRMKKNVYVTE